MYQGRTQFTHNSPMGLTRVVRQDNPAPDYGEFIDVRNTRSGTSTESLDSEGKAKSFTRLLGRFADKTSMIGPPYIYRSKSWYAKVIWIILFLGGLAGMGVHLYYSTNQFIGFPKQTKIELGFSNLLFPAVTICNLNPIKTSKISLASEDLRLFLNQLAPNIEDSNITQDPSNELESNDEFNDVEYEFGGTLDESIKIVEEFRGLYRDEKRETKIQMGHQLEEMLISCTVGKFKCFASNFTLLQHDIYGNCYTIQSDTLKITKSGMDSGLSIVLYMDKEEYITQLTEGYGARVLIHDGKTFPFPSEEGLFVPSASETQIGLKMIQIERKGKPYGDCLDGEDYEQKYGFKYTRSLCQFLCLHENIFKKCGCYEDDSTEINFQINKKNLKYCQALSDVQCMLTEKKKQLKNKADCQCINPCKETQYAKTLSSRNWPSENHMTAQFASDIGGAIGLWIGLSLLSIFEVVQLCLECCAYGIHKCIYGKWKRNRRKRNNKKSHRTQSYPDEVNDTSIQNSRDYNQQNSKRYPGIL